MARAATTADIYNAIAEPRRRQIIDLLSEENAQPRSVNDLVERMRLPQPAVSKHLGVLRKVGVVTVTKQGQQRLYQLNPDQLKTVHDWVKAFERFWSHQVDRIKQRAEQRAAERLARDN